MFGLTRTSKLREVEEERDEAQEMAEKLDTQAKVAAKGLHAAVEALPMLKSDADAVVQLSEPHVAYKAIQGAVVTGIVPEGARVVYPTTEAQDEEIFHHDKLRTDKFMPIKIDSGRWLHEEGTNSNRFYQFNYHVGEVATPSNGFDVCTKTVCAPGIHIFRKKAHAKRWKVRTM